MSELNPQAFTEGFKPLLDKLESAGVRLTAIELGNEINTSCCNGDLPDPGSGRELGLSDLNNPNDAEGRAVADGYRAYQKVMAALKDLRDHSKLNQHTPIITAGLADVDETRVKLVQSFRSALEHFVSQGRLAGIMYYDWTEVPGKPDSWAIFRCGVLTDAGRLALSPM